MLSTIFASLTTLGWLTSGNIVFLIVGVSLVVIIPFVVREFLKSLEKITPIVITADGIHTYDGFGVKAFVRWQDVRKTGNMILWPGLSWLLLDDGRNYFRLAGIPLFVEDRNALYEQIVRMAGEGHVVAVSLRERGFGSTSQ